MTFEEWYKDQVDQDLLWGVEFTTLEPMLKLGMERAWKAGQFDLIHNTDKDYEI